jgi:serine/threonine protein kinase
MTDEISMQNAFERLEAISMTVATRQTCPECGQHLFDHRTSCPVAHLDSCTCVDRQPLSNFERVVQGYRLQKAIGRGSFGTAWWAVRLTKGLFPEAVVKEYTHTGMRLDRQAQREIAALRHLGSPWIPYFIADQPPAAQDNRWLILMEYYDGTPLRDVIGESSGGGPLASPENKVEVLLQIAS